MTATVADERSAARPSRRGTWAALLRTPRFAVVAGLLAVFVVVGVIGPYITPHDAYDTNLRARLQSPGSTYWLGTDRYGRDVLSRVLAGTRVSVVVAAAVALLSLAGGVVLGAIGGYFRGWADRIVQFVVTTLLAFPGFLLALAIITVWGGSLRNIVIALVIAYTPRVAVVMRSIALSTSTRPYIEAAEVLGLGKWRILAVHVVPNSIGPVLVVAMVNAAFAMLAEAGLSFLGLGIQPPDASWGSIISDGRPYIFTHPWIFLAPGVCIALVVTALNLLGDWLRDALDPNLAPVGGES